MKSHKSSTAISFWEHPRVNHVANKCHHVLPLWEATELTKLNIQARRGVGQNAERWMGMERSETIEGSEVRMTPYTLRLIAGLRASVQTRGRPSPIPAAHFSTERRSRYFVAPLIISSGSTTVETPEAFMALRRTAAVSGELRRFIPR